VKSKNVGFFKVIQDDQISESHCSIQNVNGYVTIASIDNSQCFINNVEIKESTKLSQGDIVIVGKTVLRFNHPEEAARLREISVQTSEVSI
jgi:predicted component of type VI protein secretion system